MSRNNKSRNKKSRNKKSRNKKSRNKKSTFRKKRFMRGGTLEDKMLKDEDKMLKDEQKYLTNCMVISDTNIEPDQRGNIVLRNFPLNDTQNNALTILYEREYQDAANMFRLNPSLNFRDLQAGRDMSPILIGAKEKISTENGIVELPRTFRKLYVSSMDNDNNNRGRKLMSIDKKPYPGVCVKYQGHESNPPAYIVYIQDIEKDKEFIKSQIIELNSIQDKLSSDNLEYIDTRIQKLEGVLNSWSRINIIGFKK